MTKQRRAACGAFRAQPAHAARPLSGLSTPAGLSHAGAADYSEMSREAPCFNPSGQRGIRPGNLGHGRDYFAAVKR